MVPLLSKIILILKYALDMVLIWFNRGKTSVLACSLVHLFYVVYSVVVNRLEYPLFIVVIDVCP